MWPGGKDGAGVAQRLINQIPPHDVFVSAFLGDCAVLRKIRPAGLAIGIDLDRANVERWSAGADGSSVVEFGGASGRQFFCCDAVEWLRHRFGWYQVDGSGGDRPSPIPAAGARADDSGGEVLGKAARVARSSDARSSDATRLSNANTWFVYADPPYMLNTRASKKQLYAHEMTDGDHVRLLATLLWLPCMVMVSHYPCRLYDDALAGWRSFSFRVQTRGGRSAIEKVWCNYPVPDKLHDSQFLGRDKREREKIRRRVRRALSKVQKLPPLERQAVLDALVGGQGYLRTTGSRLR
jgi:DNA adenine methylase